MTTLGELVSAGVTRTGHWETTPDGMAAPVGTFPSGTGLYLFVVGPEVRYVGTASIGLRHRMREYQRRQVDPKARPVHVALRAAVALGESVEIFMREISCSTRTTWDGLPVSPLLGVETALIEDLHPAWNRRGRRGRLI